ncbi:hypothetical protein PV396_09660 [Streptomyces sp. ME02-8801-2C]|uniref:hypothetical protein n=1 Tax=Streptomyces sp. ME02-8801-2C TaxID=3028680 RepID=UPI0029B471CB|nr:hypothetical protein [Streptomyces sp. ME02-8801-2C]MDX3452201.1 hypothetical protein [Streptomyces sp. ME02-8801-2C]
MPDSTDSPEPTRVDRLGPFDALFLRVCAVLMGLCGPGLLACGFGAGVGVLLAGVLCTVLFVPMGLGLWFHTELERENNRRLDAVGVAATAEVTDLSDWDDGESRGVTVGLRISGPGVRTFETTWKRSSHPALRMGLRFTAVVDPGRGLFRLEL